MSKRSAKNKRIVVALVVIALVAVGGALYIKAHQKINTATYNPQSKTAANGQANGSQGGVVDNNAAGKGSASASSTTSQSSAGTPTSSSSGVITLTSPTSGATIGNGTAVSGSAGDGLTQVQYRIENADGTVVALGQLSVVNGSFSGTLEGLAPRSSTGTLEIYDYKNGNGPEENDAKINVSFK